MKILVINPGGSSTKFSVFEGRQEILKRNIKHTGRGFTAISYGF